MNDLNLKKIIKLNIDVASVLTGFESSNAPTKAHHKIMKHYSSPFFLGPPQCDELLSLIMHMFSPEEAEIVQYLPPFRARTSAKVARLSNRPTLEVEKIFNNLSFNKYVIFSSGNPRKYSILPILPGTFEMALMTHDLSTRNSWHKTFAELFEKLWDKGFVKDYIYSSKSPIRYLPPISLSKTLNMAWPSDKLEEILEPYNLFAVGNCQCRLAMNLVDKGCGKPMENCVAIGPMAKPVIERGLMRKADRFEIIEIKKNAEEHGCVTWMMNETNDWRGNASCSCCGCCCHGLRTITEFNTPGMISKPHFMPVHNEDKCTLCQKCIKACPMNAWQFADGKIKFDKIRCIGCGLCVLSCKFKALELEEIKNYEPPENGWLKLLIKMVPGYIVNSLKVWAKRINS
ncbi:MAG: 4Fe-4S binding protein [Desulfobacterales bacterium]|nr:4Fe-4S binding protein [Desulfobacterales bacterium]